MANLSDDTIGNFLNEPLNAGIILSVFRLQDMHRSYGTNIAHLLYLNHYRGRIGNSPEYSLVKRRINNLVSIGLLKKVKPERQRVKELQEKREYLEKQIAELDSLQEVQDYGEKYRKFVMGATNSQTFEEVNNPPSSYERRQLLAFRLAFGTPAKSDLCKTHLEVCEEELVRVTLDLALKPFYGILGQDTTWLSNMTIPKNLHQNRYVLAYFGLLFRVFAIGDKEISPSLTFEELFRTHLFKLICLQTETGKDIFTEALTPFTNLPADLNKKDPDLFDYIMFLRYMQRNKQGLTSHIATLPYKHFAVFVHGSLGIELNHAFLKNYPYTSASLKNVTDTIKKDPLNYARSYLQ